MRHLLVVLGAVVIVAYSLAAPSRVEAAACGADTLKNYVALGAGGCTYKNIVFSNFAYDDSQGAEQIAAADVMVGQDSDGDAYGLMFSASWNVRNTDIDAKIDYDVKALNKTKIVGETLLMNGALLDCNCATPPGDGMISVTEDTFAANLQTYKDRTDSQDADNDTIAGRINDSVSTEVFLQAGAFSSASLQSASNLYLLQVPAGAPEPETWSLLILGVGLIMIPVRRRRGNATGPALSRHI